MAYSNMNFENKPDLVEEDPPPILSREIREVFHQFASMLDIKSFMKLAMTSKKMYNRCMEDRMIKINLEERGVSVENGVPSFSFHSFDIAENYIEKYLEKLRQLKCNVSLKKIHFHGPDIDVNNIMETRRYLDELGVKTIESMKIDENFIVMNPVSFAKDYNLKNVEIGQRLPDDVIRSLLQLKMDSFSYSGAVRGDLLLQVDSSIPILKLLFMNMSADVLTQILWKIQTGVLKKLTVSFFNDFPWDGFKTIEGDHDGPLPNDRPLLVKGTLRDSNKWFLHWDGAITKCRRSDSYYEFSKCAEGYRESLPDVLQSMVSKEDVHKALAEKSSEVYCIESHFTSFFDGISVLDASHEGPFPEERPLLCKTDDGNCETYFLLNEDGFINSYHWYGGCDYGGTYDLEQNWPDVYEHIPLQKFLVKKRIENRVKEGCFECQSLKEFRKLFVDFETLPHDFSGKLPDARLLIFKNTLFKENIPNSETIKEEHRIVLYEDGSLILYSYDGEFYVRIEPCPSENLPLVMLSPENFKKIVLEAPFEKLTYTIDYDMFCDAFEGIKTISFHAFGSLPTERPLAFKSAGLENDEIFDHRWLLLEGGNVRKCDWEEGEATFSRASPREFPFILTITLVTDLFKDREVYTDLGFFIERDVLNQCLEDCGVIPYYRRKLFSNGRPQIFEKTVVKHVCKEKSKSGCECVDEILHLFFVSYCEEVIHITWDDRFLSFDKKPNRDEVPPLLKTTEFLESILKDEWTYECKIHWYGSYEDLVGYFKGHRMIDFEHEGRLPETRSLVFKWSHRSSPVFWFLRKDGLLIQCEKKDSHKRSMDIDNNGSLTDDYEDMIINRNNNKINDIDEPMDEDTPPILSATGLIVFPFFASMLDLKSFMNLAMTSKKMHKMCLEDTRVRINVPAENVVVKGASQQFHRCILNPVKKIRKVDQYLATLRKFPCSVQPKEIQFLTKFCDAIVPPVRQYIQDLRVKTIDKIVIGRGLGDLSTLAQFVKDFKATKLVINSGVVSDDNLRTLLQWKLSSFECHSCHPFPLELFLGVVSPIPEIALGGFWDDYSMEEFEEVLSRIENGTPKYLKIREVGTPWEDRPQLAFDHKGDLPVERPLVFAYEQRDEYRFLHSNGTVFTCVNYRISKCHPKDIPPVLKEKEEVYKALTKKKSHFSCFWDDFDTFFRRQEHVPLGHEGDLPERRPLVIQDSSRCNLVLNEDGSLEACKFKNSYVSWQFYNMKKTFPPIVRNVALARHILWRMVEEQIPIDEGNVLPMDHETLHECLKTVKEVPFDSIRELSTDRPLLFKKSDTRLQIWLLTEDESLIYISSMGKRSGELKIRKVVGGDPVPLFFGSKGHLKSLLQSKWDTRIPRTLHWFGSRSQYLSVMKEIAPTKLQRKYEGPLPKKRPLLFTEAANRWLLREDGVVIQCNWVDSALVMKVPPDDESFPPALRPYR